jgi:transcriptional regulator with XRE-family HTH domain
MSQTAQPVKSPDGQRERTQDPKRLRWRRHAAGLTIRQLAAKSGRSVGCISTLERGSRSADVTTLAALADALGCAITDIMIDEPKGSAA